MGRLSWTLSAAAFLRARGWLKDASQPPSLSVASQPPSERSVVDVDALDLDVVEDPVEVVLAQLLAQLVHELLTVTVRVRGQGSAAGA